MSKLTELKTELAANPAVTVLSIRRTPHHISHFALGWADWWDIFVAPTRGLYTADELQKFMVNLVSVAPTTMDSFYQGDPGMRFGKLYFDEPIGTVVTTGSSTITVTDPDALLTDDFMDGVQVIDQNRTENLLRRTLLRVYPDDMYAHRALGLKDVFSTDAPLVKRHSFRRMFSRS